GFGEVVAYMRQHDPGHPIFINLLPNYATPKQMEAANYEEYVTRFLDEVRPFALSYDHYHFAMNRATGQERDGEHFFPNLAIARRLAKERGIPFFQIVLVTQHFSFRNLTEGEIRFEAMQTLAYGGKGLLWFTYWHPKSQSIQWSHAMINRDGTRNPHYYMVQRVNRELLALGKELLPAESLSVFHAGAASIAATQKVPGGVGPRAADEMVNVVGPGEVSVGTFKRGHNEHLALVANVDYKQPLRTRVFVASGAKEPQRFDITTRTWQDAKSAMHAGGFLVDVELTPGGAALLKW
ncbi:MAG: beta-galactosidase, partial [Armatimonadetes bacterium]|nr:beta-galactosidase [Armatimonadota bacterium]